MFSKHHVMDNEELRKKRESKARIEIENGGIKLPAGLLSFIHTTTLTQQTTASP
jgi:hypothetical protein